MTIKIDIASDMHVDAWHHETKLHDPAIRMWEGEPHQSPYIYFDWRYYKNPGSRILVIAGDTANNHVTTSMVISQAAQEYEHVVFVDGNHEHYDGMDTVSGNMEMLRRSVQHLENVTYLNGEQSVTIDGVKIIGATGWYDWKAYEDKFISQTTAKQAWYRFSNDSRVPAYGKLGSPEQIAITQSFQLAEHVRAASSDESISEILVITHMSPRADLMEWKDGDVIWNSLTPSYVNTSLKQLLDADTKKKIKNWIYGHTHFRKSTEIDGIKYINNARGYPTENPPFGLIQIEAGTTPNK